MWAIINHQILKDVEKYINFILNTSKNTLPLKREISDMANRKWIIPSEGSDVAKWNWNTLSEHSDEAKWNWIIPSEGSDEANGKWNTASEHSDTIIEQKQLIHDGISWIKTLINN